MPETFPINSRTFNLTGENIDTDQIIPARFLTTTSRTGLGRFAFHDWRFDGSGSPRANSPLSGFDPTRASVLVAGRNFGCGSSREHAPWALLDYGFRAVISCEIADIFRSNAARNGLLPIVAPETAHQWLLDNPGAEVEIDLGATRVTIAGGPGFDFDIEPFARHCLLSGNDPMGYLLDQTDEIRQFEEVAA